MHSRVGGILDFLWNILCHLWMPGTLTEDGQAHCSKSELTQVKDNLSYCECQVENYTLYVAF